MFSGEKPVGHELPGTDSHCLVRHVCLFEDWFAKHRRATKATNTHTESHTLAQAIEAAQRQRLGFLYIELGFPNGALKMDCVGWIFWAWAGPEKKELTFC